MSKLFTGAAIIASMLGIVFIAGSTLSALAPKPERSLTDNAAQTDALAAAVAAGPVAVRQEPTTPDRFTKVEFASYAYGLTKAEIRRKFGKPAAVHEYDDSWYYPFLPVYDADAGIQVGVTIQFAGIGGPEDEVADIRY